MYDRSVYATILGLSQAWEVERVELREREQIVHVWGVGAGRDAACLPGVRPGRSHLRVADKLTLPPLHRTPASRRARQSR